MEIQVRINSDGALRNQRYAFTDRYTLISELLQNARRAGATLVEVSHDRASRTLRVRDNGRGVDDFQKLLTFHESGWDQALQQQEHPFGAGFSKCLYASTRCIVSSGGLEADIDTAAALARSPIPVRPSATGAEPGTVIELHGVDLAELEVRIDRMCRGFPVPVEFNGRPLQRPDAIDVANGERFRDTSVGAIRLMGTLGGECSALLRLYLQGFCVYRSSQHSDAVEVNVVHLDPARHLARLPDRDKLIDEDVQVKVVGEEVKRLWREILEIRKATLPAAEFVERFYSAMSTWRHMDLLDDVPILPSKLCDVITSFPVQETYSSCSVLETVPQPLTRDDVESGRVRLVSLDAPHGESMASWTLAKVLDMVVVNEQALGKRHWCRRHVRALDTEDASVRAVGETHRTRLDGRWVWADVVLCERVCIRIGADTVFLDDDGVFHNETLFIPAGEKSGWVVQQASNFLDSNDCFHEDDMEADCDALAELIQRMRAVDPVATLGSMLARLNLERFPLMVGRTFRLSVGSSSKEHILELLG